MGVGARKVYFPPSFKELGSAFQLFLSRDEENTNISYFMNLTSQISESHISLVFVHLMLCLLSELKGAIRQ